MVGLIKTIKLTQSFQFVIIKMIIEISGGVLASTWYVGVREHVERCLCAR